MLSPDTELAVVSLNRTQLDPKDRATQAALHISEYIRNYSLVHPNSTASLGLHSSGKKAAPQQTGPGGVSLANLVETPLFTVLFPALVTNVLNPIIKTVADGNVGSVYSYIRRWTGTDSSADTTSEKPAQSAAPVRKVPTRTRVKVTTESANNAMDLTEENGPSIAPGKSKYRVIPRRNRTTTSTNKPLDEIIDDEDDSDIVSKIKTL